MMTFFFSNLTPFISFTSLLSLASTPGLKGMAKRHPCLATNLREKSVQFFIIKYNVNYRLFIYNFSIMFSKFPFISCFTENFSWISVEFWSHLYYIGFLLPNLHTSYNDERCHCPFSCLLSEHLEKENYFKSESK